MLENFGRKSKSPEPSLTKPRKLSVDEVSPPVPKRRKKKKKIIADPNGSETDIYHSMNFLDVSAETWHQPIEQKDHWGLPRELKANSDRSSSEDLPSSQTTPLDYKAIGMLSGSDIIPTNNLPDIVCPKITSCTEKLQYKNEFKLYTIGRHKIIFVIHKCLLNYIIHK